MFINQIPTVSNYNYDRRCSENKLTKLVDQVGNGSGPNLLEGFVKGHKVQNY